MKIGSDCGGGIGYNISSWQERKKTIKVMQPDDIISFGKYKGKTIKEICDIDRNYLIWLSNNSSDIKIDFSKL